MKFTSVIFYLIQDFKTISNMNLLNRCHNTKFKLSIIKLLITFDKLGFHKQTYTTKYNEEF